MQIGGTTAGAGYSQLSVAGTVTLNGTLNIALINQFLPTVGQTFTVLTTPSLLSGTFSMVNGTAIDANEHFSVSYASNNVVLTVVAGP